MVGSGYRSRGETFRRAAPLLPRGHRHSIRMRGLGEAKLGCSRCNVDPYLTAHRVLHSNDWGFVGGQLVDSGDGCVLSI